MTPRGQDAARRAFLASVQPAVSRVSPAVVLESRTIRTGLPVWTFDDRFVPLRGASQLEFSLLLRYESGRARSGPSTWGSQVVEYAYHVRHRSGANLIRFEWHPLRHEIRFPHLHVQGQAGPVRIDQKLHIPTGIVPFSQVIRFLIEELDVLPIRPDWRQIVDPEGDEGTPP